MSDDLQAELLALLLAPRPDRLNAAVTEQMPAEVRPAAAAVAETLAALPLAEPPAAPAPALRARILATVAQPESARRALVVMDMIRDHLEPGSVLEVPRARTIVEALRRRLDEARAAGIPVVYVLDRHDPADSDLKVWGTHAVEGSRGAEVWPDLAPHQGDRVLTKPSYSGFFQSDLEKVLDELEVDTLVLTGCATDVQLFVTAADAMQLGFAVEVPADSQAGFSADAEAAALATMSVLVPYGPSRDARLARLRAHAAAPSP